jgi:hypothetical protein
VYKAWRSERAPQENTVAAPVPALRKTAVSLAEIVAEGLLRPPVHLMAQYRGRSLRATVQIDGSILLDGVPCASPSTAARLARKPFQEESVKGRRPPSTNGWTFWKLQDPASNEMVPLDTLRVRYVQRKKTEAERAAAGS